MAAAAEMWAERHHGMVKAEKGTAGFDGTVPDGRKLQVKSKKHGAPSPWRCKLPTPKELAFWQKIANIVPSGKRGFRDATAAIY